MPLYNEKSNVQCRDYQCSLQGLHLQCTTNENWQLFFILASNSSDHTTKDSFVHRIIKLIDTNLYYWFSFKISETCWFSSLFLLRPTAEPDLAEWFIACHGSSYVRFLHSSISSFGFIFPSNRGIYAAAESAPKRYYMP